MNRPEEPGTKAARPSGRWRTVGIVLMGVAVVSWALAAVAGFLPLPGGQKVLTTATLLVGGEVVFWVAAAVLVRDGAIAEARVGLTNMGATPIRARGVEGALLGAPATAEAITAAARHAAEGTSATADASADVDYREHLAEVLTGRAVATAVGV